MWRRPNAGFPRDVPATTVRPCLCPRTMPGPPREMFPMFLGHVLPRIRAKASFEVWEGKSFGLPEGHVDGIVLGVVLLDASGAHN